MRTTETESAQPVLFPRDRVALYWAAMEFHAVAVDWVPSRRGGNTLRTQLERATFRAVLSIGQAASGTDRRARKLLISAREALDRTLSVFESLLLQRRISREIYDEARRRIGHLVQGLDQLAEVAVDRWSEVLLAPMARSERGDVQLIDLLHSMVPAPANEVVPPVEVEAKDCAVRGDPAH
jgi:hypothetical protein